MSFSMSDKPPSGYKSGQFRNMTPQQMQIMNQMAGMIGPESYLSKLAGGDQGLFNEIEAPAKKQFGAQLGNIASRFSQMGGRHSSGFQNTTSQAASDFAQQLQSNRQGLQRQGMMDLAQIAQMLMGQRPFENWMQPKREKQGIDWGSLISQGIGAGAGFLAGGSAGGAAGSKGGDLLWQAMNTRG